MRFLSLFAGIGGFDLGLERAGMQCAGQVEINPFCQRVLAHHWPDVKRIGDIYDVTESDFGAVDLVCGGFPCQPFSHAGKRRGKEDDRYLWPEMLRVIKAYRPAWVFGENVAGIVQMELDNVLSDLEREDYETQAFLIPACAVDAPHERKRVWIVAHSDVRRNSGRSGQNCETNSIQSVSGTKVCSGMFSRAGDVALAKSVGSGTGFCEIGTEQDRDFFADSGTYVPDANSSGCGERWRAESVQQEHSAAQCSGQTVSHTECGGLQNGPLSRISIQSQGEACDEWGKQADDVERHGSQWLPEPGVGRVANGVPGRVDRLRCLGNAVVPQVVEVIGRAIIRAHAKKEAK